MLDTPNGAQIVLWNEDRTAHPTSFARFFHLISNKTALYIKSSALEAFLVHTVLLNLKVSYKRSLVQSGHTLMNFLTGESAVKLQGVKNELTEIKEYLFGYFCLYKLMCSAIFLGHPLLMKKN